MSAIKPLPVNEDHARLLERLANLRSDIAATFAYPELTETRKLADTSLDLTSYLVRDMASFAARNSGFDR